MADGDLDHRVTRLETRSETDSVTLSALVREVEKLRRDINAVQLELRELIVSTQTERRLLRSAGVVVVTLAGAAGWLVSFIFEHWRK